MRYCNIEGPDSVLPVDQFISDFQKLNDMDITGVLDTATRNKLLSVLDFRYMQICLNLDRLRKLETNNAEYLLVNIPEYTMHLITNNVEKESFKVIVGKTDTPTPILSSKIIRIIANPDWTVPTTIAQNEFLSKIRTDSAYLEKNGYIIVDRNSKPVSTNTINWLASNPLGASYYIRQNSSESNALGKLKFVFPNEYSVYMHDTPSKRLFSNKKRSYSHGCIRVQNPEKLAQYLADLNTSVGGDSINIQNLIEASKQRVLNLRTEMPIHIQYITCMGDKSGDIHFLNDVYNLDEKAINELFPV
jgi:murein L,D-transpeptidase YcbB/YkuD